MDGTGRLSTPIDVTFNTTVNGLPASYRIVGQWVGLTPFPIADLNGAASGADTTLNFTGERRRPPSPPMPPFCATLLHSQLDDRRADQPSRRHE